VQEQTHRQNNDSRSSKRREPPLEPAAGNRRMSVPKLAEENRLHARSCLQIGFARRDRFQTKIKPFGLGQELSASAARFRVGKRAFHQLRIKRPRAVQVVKNLSDPSAIDVNRTFVHLLTPHA
jgi:hypothetical protein